MNSTVPAPTYPTALAARTADNRENKVFISKHQHFYSNSSAGIVNSELITILFQALTG